MINFNNNKTHGGGGHTCKVNFFRKFVFSKKFTFSRHRCVNARDFKTLSLERQGETVPCHVATKNAEHSEEEQNLKRSAQILTGGLKLKPAFTLAEVLITLAIIGVVAALTIPTVVKNYQKRETEVKLKKFYSIMSNALVQAQAKNGDMKTWNWGLSPANFFDTYIAPELNVVRKCTEIDSDTKCLKNRNYLLVGTNTYTAAWNRWRRAYVLKDGSVVFHGTNPTSANQYNGFFIYVDLDGKKGKNRFGYDTFSFFIVRPNPTFRGSNFVLNDGSGNYAKFYPQTSRNILYPDGYGLGDSALRNETSGGYRGCSKTGNHTGLFCSGYIMKNNWKIPEDYPW